MRILRILSISLLGVAAFGKSPVDPINRSSKGVALKGYDAVAYFTESKAVKGTADFAYEWQGATWYFATAADRDLFKADPAKFAPQFGGYCAWAVGHNYTADADPEAWKIVDGKLYVNYSRDIQGKWVREMPKLIDDGNRNWPGLHK